ncbi:MAG: CHRD domain-containing protein [Chthoniobacteraceae bacterium]
MKKLLLLALTFASVARLNAAIIPLDLQGKAGFGLLIGNENPAVLVGGLGGEVGAGITFNDATNVLTLNFGWGTGNNAGFVNLTGVATAGHIHGPTASTGVAAFTQSASPLITLDTLPAWNTSASSGGLTNTTVSLTAGQAVNLLAGQLYVNVHTAANGGGEIRGYLVQVPEPSVIGLLGLGASGMLFRRRRA